METLQAVHLDLDITGVVLGGFSIFTSFQQIKSPSVAPLSDHKTSKFVDHTTMLQDSANQQLEINLTKSLLAGRGVLVFGVAVQLVATVSKKHKMQTWPCR